MKEQFLQRMKKYLKDEFSMYEQSLQQPLYRGLRVNTAKISVEDFLNLHICTLKLSKICKEAFYLPDDVQGLGNHPAHLAGLYYMQEPSASSVVEVLDVKQGDWVLDLCAAPGGKSTQIAAKLQHTGFLVSNEIDGKRAQILMSNMERLGFSECMITNAHPKQIAEEMSGWFDKVLVDAPCSGEGMFKKHEKAMEDWSLEHVQACAQRQKQVLDSAYATLKEGGILVYSTCTYAMEENEEVVADFLKRYPDMELVDANVTFGRQGFLYEGIDHTKVVRIFPMDEGEGHFVAKFKKKGKQVIHKKKELASIQEPLLTQFLKQQLGIQPKYVFRIQDKVYMKQTPFLQLKKIPILRQGICCGTIIKQRLEPHQHFYTASLYQDKCLQYCELNDKQVHLFLQGNQLAIPGYKGYTCMRWKGYALGFAKGDGMVLKNKYPKGMRIR